MALNGIVSLGSTSSQTYGYLGAVSLASADGAEIDATTKATSALSTPDSATSAAPTAPTAKDAGGYYINPSIQVDNLAGLVVTRYLDPVTGQEQFQIPSKQVVAAYRLRALSTPPYNPFEVPRSFPPSAGSRTTTGDKTSADTSGQGTGGQGDAGKGSTGSLSTGDTTSQAAAGTTSTGGTGAIPTAGLPQASGTTPGSSTSAGTGTVGGTPVAAPTVPSVNLVA